MGLFDKFKKKQPESEDLTYEEKERITPDQFQITDSFEGIIGDGYAAGMDFDLNQGYYRDKEDPDVIYDLSMILGYDICIATAEGMIYKSFQLIDDQDNIQCIYVNIMSLERSITKPVGICFYEPAWEVEASDLEEDIRKASDFIEFLEDHGIGMFDPQNP